MTVKAAALVISLEADTNNPGNMILHIVIAGLDPTNTVTTNIYMDNVTPTISSILLESAIENATKTKLINDYSYTFGLFDSVRLIGALL